jgi:hypothetical protein
VVILFEFVVPIPIEGLPLATIKFLLFWPLFIVPLFAAIVAVGGRPIPCCCRLLVKGPLGVGLDKAGGGRLLGMGAIDCGGEDCCSIPPCCCCWEERSVDWERRKISSFIYKFRMEIVFVLDYRILIFNRHTNINIFLIGYPNISILMGYPNFAY